MKKIFLQFVSLSFLLVCPRVLSAHPHVFIESNVDFIVSGGKVTHAEIKWVFDPMFSEQVHSACDRNGNRRIDLEEVPSVRKGFFRNLKESRYFLYAWINGQYVRRHTVVWFHAETNKDGNVVYRFRVPLIAPASGQVKIKIMNNDPGLFVAFISRPGTSRIRGKLDGARAVNNAKSQFQFTSGK